MVKSSDHLGDQWRKRVSPRVPSNREISGFLHHCVRIQGQEDLLTADGVPYRVLGAYWVPECNLVLRVDEKALKVVTVLTPELASKWM